MQSLSDMTPVEKTIGTLALLVLAALLMGFGYWKGVASGDNVAGRIANVLRGQPLNASGNPAATHSTRSHVAATA